MTVWECQLCGGEVEAHQAPGRCQKCGRSGAFAPRILAPEHKRACYEASARRISSARAGLAHPARTPMDRLTAVLAPRSAAAGGRQPQKGHTMPRTKKPCNMPDCPDKPVARGLCGKHYYWLNGKNDEKRILAERYATESTRVGPRKQQKKRPRKSTDYTEGTDTAKEARPAPAPLAPLAAVSRRIVVGDGSMVRTLEALTGDPPSLAEIRRQGGRIREGAAEVLAALGVEILATARVVQDAQRQLDSALAAARAELAARAATEPSTLDPRPSTLDPRPSKS